MGLGGALFEVEVDVDPIGWEVVLLQDVPPDKINYLGEYAPNTKPENY